MPDAGKKQSPLPCDRKALVGNTTMWKYTSLLAAVVALCLTGTSEANNGKGGSGRSAGSGMNHRGHDYRHGHRGLHNDYRRYHDSHYRGWTRRFYHERWKSNFYYCPTDACWYYWYAPKAVYYPTSMLSEYPPVACKTEPVVDVKVRVATGGDVPNLPTPRPR